ncbi:hypothetical protein GO988_15965 [Hymenobacter sp. HMF4947]|uniref:Uncharacterized protein n=1 Tax=Hymenobacter ginkgonis TaxID=2682976 RepID=A0A7K1THE2_9BACT|nr:hypothetical protein [Hymenobacter ginkgonis]MVN77828.1 hypothetical protein [Hymenobacter ginkgonis]
MKLPSNLTDAATFLARTFNDYAGGESQVMFLGRDQQGRVGVVVSWEGDEMVCAMLIEAFLVKQGETIIHRSQKKAGKTLLVYKTKPHPR